MASDRSADKHKNEFHSMYVSCVKMPCFVAVIRRTGVFLPSSTGTLIHYLRDTQIKHQMKRFDSVRDDNPTLYGEINPGR